MKILIIAFIAMGLTACAREPEGRNLWKVYQHGKSL